MIVMTAQHECYVKNFTGKTMLFEIGFYQNQTGLEHLKSDSMKKAAFLEKRCSFFYSI